MTTPESIEKFITRWQSAGGSERANAYVFERRVTFAHGDGPGSWRMTDG
jgi:hypothetical protein